MRKFKLKNVLFFLSYFLLIQTSWAQLSFDLMQFPTDLENYINKSGNKSATDAVAEFVGYYTANQLTNPQKAQVVKLSNTLVNKNMSITAFDNYLRAMNGLIESGQVSKFDKWHKAAGLALNQSKDGFAAFAEISRHVFQDHIVAKVGSMTWITDNAEVEMDLKSEEPSFVFKNMNLYCYTPGDTLTVTNTGGRFMASNNTWMGSGGVYRWTRVGYDSAEIYADLKNYTIDFSNGNLRADTALLHYPALFKDVIPGRLFDKPMAQSMGVNSMYPQFESHKKNFSNISFGKAKLTGAFGLKGRILQGKGTDSSEAELLFSFKGKPTFKILAREFMVRESKVGAKKAAMILYLDKDSIYHPQIEFTYRLDNDFMHIYRNDEGISAAPFYDTYHQIEFYCDELKWDMVNPKIDVDMVNDNEPAKFESVNYFRDLRYERVQGILDYNPLQRVKLYCDKRNIKGFFIEDYAATYKANLSDIRIQMIELNDRGYVTFDVNRDYVHVKRKLYDYVNAHFGKTDFDAIAFFSIIKRYPNATISLINNDLQIQGVPKFQFSDSQNVYIIPYDQIVTIKKNRNMDLAGRIRAGKVDFFGNGFAFDYNTFQIRLNNVDSMKFLYHDDVQGLDLPIKSALQNVFGTLAIDHPGNKSGRKKIPGYPVFKSDVGSKIFYDKPTTQQGVYDRNRFYFDVDPFTLDSLSSLSFENITLGGTLISGGIIPDLRYEVTVQPDKSLGFRIGKTDLGYPLYGGKGRGYVALSLSDEGFFGNGEMRYLSSMSASQQFTYLLDSMNAHCSTFNNERNEIYPTAQATDVYEHWAPYNDTLYVSSTRDKIAYSDKRGQLDGTLMLTPQRMAAKGVNYIREAQLVSNQFWFQPDAVLADTSYFRMRNYTDSSKFAFYSGSVNANVQFNTSSGLFVYNTPGVNTDFTYNMYVGSFKQFSWRMNDHQLDFESKQESGKDVSYLLSTRKSQDSLQFVSGLTTLDLKDFTMYARKIPYIAVGDAWIYPDSQQVVIRADANMDQLRMAKIVADTVQKYHTIEKSYITLSGRFTMIGTGEYQYMNKNKELQRFLLDEIKIDENHRLLGKTNIPDSTNFHVGNHIAFKGSSLLKSIQKNLEYDGYFLAKHDLPYPRTDWFRNSAVINPDSVYLPVDSQLINPMRQAMMCGINVSGDSTHVYPLFFSRKRNGSDHELMRLHGTLVYDERSKSFKLGPYDKVYGGTGTKGNYMEVNPANKNIQYEGRFRMGYEGSKFEIGAAGSATYSYLDTTFRMKLMMMLNFPFPPAASRIMFDTLNEQSSNAPAATFEQAMFAKSLSDLMTDEKALNRVLEDLPDNNIRMVNELEKTIFISMINLRWNQPTRSFVSEGEISLNSLDKYKIERKFYGKLEMVKKRTGDDFTLYLQSPEGSWYFFKYQKGMMFTLSSDPVYNQYVKDGMDKISKKAKDFSLRMANISDRNKFVRNMKTQK